jgi:hypothetical protein
MIVSYILILVSLVAVASFLLVARFGFSPIRSKEEFSARILPVDLKIIANLYDSEQVDYVRSRLSAREFSSFERERTLVLIEYVRRISANAALLVGYAHYMGEQQRVGVPGELFTLALKVRFQCFFTLALLSLKAIWPSASIRVDNVMDSYRIAMASLSNQQQSNPAL